MSELSAVRSALDRIRAEEHVRDVALISREGMFVMGNTPESTHRETFSTMCAVIAGAGQTITNEMKDRMERIKVMMGENDLVLIGAGPRYLIAVTVDRGMDGGRLVQEVRSVVENIENVL